MVRRAIYIFIRFFNIYGAVYLFIHASGIHTSAAVKAKVA